MKYYMDGTTSAFCIVQYTYITFSCFWILKTEYYSTRKVKFAFKVIWKPLIIVTAVVC